MADDIARLGYEIDSSQAISAATNLDKMNAAAGRVVKGADNTANAAERLAKSTQVANRHILNMGFQFQDIGMMMASGQSPFILAMQQGTQVAGIFNQLRMEGQKVGPALIGGITQLINPMSILTIGAIAGAAALVQWGMAALDIDFKSKTLEETIKDLNDAFDRYQETAERASMSTKELRDTYGTASETLRSTLELLNQIAKSEAQEALDASAKALAELLGVSGAGEKRAAIADFFDVNIFLAFTQEARNTREVARELTAEFLNAQYALADAKGNAEGQHAALLRMLDAAKKLADADGERTRSEEDLLKSIAEQIIIAEKLLGMTRVSTQATYQWADAMSSVKDELDLIAATISSLGGGAISAAAKQTEIAALRAGKSVKEAAQAASNFKENLKVDAQVNALESRFGVVGKVLGSVVKGQSQYNQELDATLEKEREAARERERDSKKSGGLSADPKLTSERLQALLQSLRTEREVVDEWYEQSQIILNDRRVQEILGEQEHNEAKLRLEREYQKRLAGVRMGYNGTALDQAQTFFGEMASAMASGNDKMARAAQVFAGIESLINAYRAYNQVLADPTLPWFAKIPAAVSVLAAGMKTVQAIKGVGGGGGSGGAPSSAAATAAPQEPERIVRVAFDGPDWARSIIEPIMEQIYEQTRDGTRVIFQR